MHSSNAVRFPGRQGMPQTCHSRFLSEGEKRSPLAAELKSPESSRASSYSLRTAVWIYWILGWGDGSILQMQMAICHGGLELGSWLDGRSRKPCPCPFLEGWGETENNSPFCESVLHFFFLLMETEGSIFLYIFLNCFLILED